MKDQKYSIELITSPSSITEGIVSEVVFSHLLEAYGPNIVKDDVLSKDFFKGVKEEEISKLISKFNEYKNTKSTYKFQYELLDGKLLQNVKTELFPLKGIIAIFIMLTAWISTLLWYKDKVNQIYIAFSPNKRSIAGLISVLVPVLLVVIVSSTILTLKYGLLNGAYELINLLFYAFSISLLIYGLKIFFKNPIAYATLIPVSLLGSLIASPIILDMKSLIPYFNILEKFFLPSYYLALFSNKIWAVLTLFSFIVIGSILTLLENKVDYKN